MDIAYDHIQEEVLSPDASNSKDKKEGAAESSLSAEFAQAYNAISSSSWGARFGALVGSVRKQVLRGVSGLLDDVADAPTI